MNPTKADVNALVTVLEDESHADAESMAKAVWAMCLDRLSLHSTYAVGVKAPDTVHLYGPLWTYRNAQTYAATHAAAGDVPFIYPMNPAVFSAAAEVNNDNETCPKCGHVKTLHVDRKWRPYWSKVADPLIDPGCGHFDKKVRCACKETFGLFKSGRNAVA